MNSTLFLPLLSEFLVKSAAIFLAALLADRAWRRASAAQRHGIWLAAFAALLLLPATRLIAPRWNLAPVHALPTVHVHVSDEFLEAREEQAEPTSMAAPTTAMTRTEAVSQPFDWSAMALRLWLAGSVALLGLRALGGARLHFLWRSSAPADPALQAALRQAAAEARVSRSITLRVSDTCRVPLTWGTLHPVLMLPTEAATWTGDRLPAALRHECAHIRRSDYAVRLLADFVRACYWPNPLAWLASRALRTAQEQACDDLVLGAGTSPTGYATLLCEVARGFAAPPGAVAMAQPSTLEARVRAIVDATRNRRPTGPGFAVIGALAVVLALILSSTAQLRAVEEAAKAKAAAPEPANSAERVSPDNPKEVSFEWLNEPANGAGTNKMISPDGTKGPQIKIEAKFVEIATDEIVEDVLPVLGTPAIWAEKARQTKINLPDGTFSIVANPGPLYIVGVFTDPAYQTLARKLDTTKGVTLLSSPRVITHSKQNATIAIGSELRYATAWEKGTTRGAWKPTAFETKNCGSTLEIEPEIGPDGYTIDLGIKSQVIELLGYADPDTGKPIAAGKDGPEAEGPRRKAVFSTSKTGKSTTTVSIFDGQTVLMELARAGQVKPFANKAPKGRTLVFVTASMVLPNGEKVPPPAPKPGPPQIEIEARFVQVTPGKTNADAAVAKPAPASPEKFALVGDRRAIDTLLFGNKSAALEGGGTVFQDFIADARKKKNGVDVLAMPRVTTKTGQRAVIEMIRERRYATEWKEGTKHGKWKPTAFETRNCGATLEVEPTLQADGTIALDLIPQVVEFLGFDNLDTGKPMPRGADDSAPEGPRLKAVFSAFKLKTNILLKPGETVMLEPLEQTEDVKPFADRVREGRLTVFITATTFEPANPLPAAK